ncbi:prepilin-type N-terminal cleavage/methylation domain-containing protein [Thermosynechococcus sichuanensis E542]|uniref:Prepilin-type N-terminal cleavage/methylation domain-containing protein n=1 Tax=Thermosynechococcus sichuanensis E542 TaxID=2016101 RepID=A0A3B7M9Q5_9CYAN|nr:prepilin-type N-terminal cleavage/methylation domain-containing protein [Thermosynechococcus vestitus]AXY67349.1 prepilin-type N-terminal cleavage/methylation domain-containing protein [Thermosynechococcus vestitus E542]
MKLWRWQRPRKRQRGFTLVEILVSLVMASVIVVSLGALLIDMLQTETREASLNQLRQDLKAAMDIISTDLSQAVFVYNGNCLAGGGGECGGGTRSQALTNFLPPFPSTMQPVLAMWILEPVPYDQNQLGYDTYTIPANCNNAWPESLRPDCIALQNARRAHTLVVYYLDTTPSSLWQGRARLRRYALRKYRVLTNTYLELNQGYVEPSGFTNFAQWPINVNTNASMQGARPEANMARAVVVTDFIDLNWDNESALIPCQGAVATPFTSAYVRTPLASSGVPNSFYACVQSRGASFNNATFVYLRGNPQGMPGIRPQDEATRPVITTTVLSRSVQRKVPNF